MRRPDKSSRQATRTTTITGKVITQAYYFISLARANWSRTRKPGGSGNCLKVPDYASCDTLREDEVNLSAELQEVLEPFPDERRE